MKTNTLKVLVLFAILAIASGGYVIYYTSTYITPTFAPSQTKAPASSVTVAFPVALTDPPSVPQGTTALWLNYSGIELITNSSPIFMNTRGSVNLLKLVNVSEVIAVFNVSKGVAVNQIRFFINSAEIEINGATYPVFLPSGILKIPVNNATQGALVDLQPHVVVAQVGQTPEYILTPVATAMPYNPNLQLGQIKPLPLPILKKLNSTVANLSIVSASLSYAGAETNFSIMIKNNGNTPATIYGVKLSGKWETYIGAVFNQTKIMNFKQLNIQGVPLGFNGTLLYNGTVVFFVENGSLVPFPNAPMSRQDIHIFGNNQQAVNFNNSQPPFSIPINYTPPRWFGNFGITLQPGQSVTLNFSGVISPFEHGWQHKPTFITNMELYTTPVNGSLYNIRLISAPASNASYTVKAIEKGQTATNKLPTPPITPLPGIQVVSGELYTNPNVLTITVKSTGSIQISSIAGVITGIGANGAPIVVKFIIPSVSPTHPLAPGQSITYTTPAFNVQFIAGKQYTITLLANAPDGKIATTSYTVTAQA